jgi:hypothetical protein
MLGQIALNKVISDVMVNQITLDVSALPAGMYYIYLKTNNGIYAKPVIKQ